MFHIQSNGVSTRYANIYCVLVSIFIYTEPKKKNGELRVGLIA
jgi:hypothetical protein